MPHEFEDQEKTLEILWRYQTNIAEIVKTPVNVQKIDGQSTNILFTDLNRNLIGKFSLVPMPGCCGVVCSIQTEIGTKYRGLKISYPMIKCKFELSKMMKYGLMVCTVLNNNEPEKKALARSGWTHISSFLNPKTGNLVDHYSIDLNKENLLEF